LESFVFWVEFDHFFSCFLDKFANIFSHKIEKKNTLNLWCHRISISCDNLFQIEKKGVLGFLVTQISKRKKRKKTPADSIPSNSGK
jgi:hypothetical protein